MKTTLKPTATQFASFLVRCRKTMRAALPQFGATSSTRHLHVLKPVDPSRIPAFLRRRRLLLRTQSRFDAQALNLWQEGPR